MKIILISFLIIIHSIGVCGQDTKVINMTEDKITQLIFPATIQSSKGGFLPSDFAINVEDNVLYIQPVGSFLETNINIITVDGCYYTFVVKYSPNASIFNFIFTPQDAIFNEKDAPYQTERNKKGQGQNSAEKKLTNTTLENICKRILSKRGYLVSGNMGKFKNVSLLIKGIYVDNEYIYLRLVLNNRSNINYDMDYIAYTIKGVKSKRISTQENLQITPKDTYMLPEVIYGKQEIEIVASFDKFTIGEDKYLEIRMIENKGERNITLKVSNQLLSEAQYYD